MPNLYSIIELIVATIVVWSIDVLSFCSAWNSGELFSRTFWILFVVFSIWVYYDVYVKPVFEVRGPYYV